MDKRTLLLAITLSLSFLLINSYFEKQRIDDLKKWNSEQKVLYERKIKDLETEIANETTSIQSLNPVAIYTDMKGTEKVATGFLVDESVLTLAWNNKLPEIVYIKKNESDVTSPIQYKIAFTSDEKNTPAVYQQKPVSKFTIGSLPYFGKFPIQIASLPPKETQEPAKLTLAQYTDGALTFPGNKLEQLRHSIEPDYKKNMTSIIHDGLVFVKSGQTYLPVAYYQSHNDSLVYLEQIEGLVALTQKAASSLTAQDGKQKFYVLENDYLQLVFTNRGGALAEINLPFESATNQRSIVKEIGIDRYLTRNEPYNELFPANPYFTPAKESNVKMEEHPEGKLGGYYPLLRRDLIDSGNRETINVLPSFYALNLVSEYPETAEMLFEVKHFDSSKIVFESVQRHRKITKTFTLPQDETAAPYVFDLKIDIEGDARGLWLTTGVPEVEWISNSPAPTLKYRMTRNQKSSVENISLPSESTVNTSVSPDWICSSNGFLGMILDPLTPIDPGFRAQYVSGTMMPSRLTEVDQQYDRYSAKNMPGYLMMLPLKNSGGTIKFRMFAGPFATEVLKKVDAAYSDPATGYTPDYISCQSSHGWFTFISAPFSKFLMMLMTFFHSITHSWGLSIILLTIALRLMLYPLNAWSAKSMLKMQQIQPEVTQLQERYKNDPKKLQVAMMELYREKGVNPLSGCFPLLIQMPFLIGMFDLLKSTFELRGAPFIPGWINDLAAPDVLFSWNYSLPIIGNEFHLLPILSGLVMYLQQRLMSPTPSDPSKLTDQQKQQKMMGTFMAIFLAFIFYNFPSGLNIYFLSSSLLGILQQWVTKKTMKPLPTTVVVEKNPKKAKGR